MPPDLAAKRCVPCAQGGPALAPAQAQALLTQLQGWALVDGKLLRKPFKFPDFIANMRFVNRVAELAEAEDHHPDLRISYSRLTIELTTHAVQGLSENDFIVAAKIDQLSP
jgi:4a-hydroxytetrahydrobiopterin dehydratase